MFFFLLLFPVPPLFRPFLRCALSHNGEPHRSGPVAGVRLALSEGDLLQHRLVWGVIFQELVDGVAEGSRASEV